MRTILVLLGWICLLVPVLGMGQQITIRGKVTDATTGEPIPFGTVLVPKRIGAMTDFEGKYILNLAGIPDTLIVHATDYKSQFITGLRQKIPANAFAFNLDIQLQESEKECIDCLPPSVLIIGYIPQMDRLSTTTTRRSDNSSIEQGMNLIPGVKFESRGPGGSRRLAIRGGFLRSPFGVRDVKVYLQGSPLTSPDGATPLELIDPQLIGLAEIKKGPFASEYGAVSSGVGLFSPSYGEGIGNFGGMVSATIGSFGYQRLLVQATTRTDQGPHSVTFIRQKYAGYRAQEANDKYQFQYAGNYRRGDHTIFGNLLLYQGAWELPGGLDSLQVANDPRQALPLSESLDAHVERRHLRATLGHSWVARNWGFGTTAYLHLSDKINPYGTSAFFQGYKIESSEGFGGRSVLIFPTGKKFKLLMGGEYQYESLHFQEFENLNGQPGNLLTRTLTHSVQAHGYVEGQFNSKAHRLKAQLSLNKVRYAQKDAFSSVIPLANGATQFRPALASTLEWALHATDNYKNNFFLCAATGYSPPGLWEVTDSLGRIQSNLKPETGLNLEIRTVSRLVSSKIQMEWNIYHYLLWNAIVPKTLSSGTTVYENKGGTRQMGIEGMVKYKFRIAKLIKDGSIAVNGAYQHYLFRDYQLDAEDLSGNRLPGVPSFTLNFIGDVLFKFGGSLQLSANRVGKNYMNNANTAEQPAYLLLNAKVGQHFYFNGEHRATKVALFPYIGVNNILNTEYTNFPQLNAAGGKYWNPSPRINYFGGMNFNF